VPLHLQECFEYLGQGPGSLPVSEACALETIALPIFPELRQEQLQAVVDGILAFLRA
jgi:dTDP-4-amino-4,6-dideoxygalactose transaminase